MFTTDGVTLWLMRTKAWPVLFRATVSVSVRSAAAGKDIAARNNIAKAEAILIGRVLAEKIRGTESLFFKILPKVFDDPGLQLPDPLPGDP